ncbi:hypothetical protein [Roseinatronobacter alkalisoli]|uniref:Major facilitator superfamily (MFS) profile domain-containing protein n=1 Tax=Roseinatronobacter alkalisoli TaxID=3028235 RepID=A0ABT5T801_9RHOB|nr:hypothetical protein [Roseinatronobacter sp. HJB301]MDD7971258.1 hypothetical protein [Roseinatronobacter sp. HJB301]
MLFLSMLLAIITGLFAAALVFASGYGLIWAFLAYSLFGAAGFVLAGLGMGARGHGVA